MDVKALVVVSWCVVAQGRGPHHPRSQRSHRHHRPKADITLTADSQLLHDTHHIQEDARELSQEALANMTPAELDFHYFTAHDFDRNSKLDGLELLKAIYHTEDHENKYSAENSSIESDSDEFESYVALIDNTLETDDVDCDGYISYAEYRAARERHGQDQDVLKALSTPEDSNATNHN